MIEENLNKIKSKSHEEFEKLLSEDLVNRKFKKFWCDTTGRI
jgi:hypothetical protein